MNRNKADILSTDQILTAARTVYLITKLLKLTRQQWEDMYSVDVLGKITQQDATRGELFAYANGVRETYTTILITEHCEFVYYADGVRLNVKEATQQGPGVLNGAVCGYQWLDSEFNFTEFQQSIDLWI